MVIFITIRQEHREKFNKKQEDEMEMASVINFVRGFNSRDT